MMTRKELVETLIGALRESQRHSGHDEDATISEATVPIGDLVDFDSLNAVEVTVALEEHVGCTLPVNIFAEDSTHRPLSVAEIVDRLLSMKPVRES